MSVKTENTTITNEDEGKILGKIPSTEVPSKVKELPDSAEFLVKNVKNETSFIYLWKQVNHMFRHEILKRILTSYPEAVEVRDMSKDKDLLYVIGPYVNAATDDNSGNEGKKTEKPLTQLNKAELLAKCTELGLTVEDNLTNKQMVEAIKAKLAE